MTEEENNFVDQCMYFWKYKEDMERYSGFDIERLERLNPLLAKAWKEYKLSRDLLNKLTEDCY